MYDAYFNFDRRPFVSVPHVEQYFAASSMEAARQTIARCIQRGQGAAIVVGPSGTGKTLLCQVLAEQFRESLRVAMLASGRLSTRRNLFQAILYELGRPYQNLDEGELRIALAEFLLTNEDCLDGMLLLVDEAHTLPLRLLEEIRMLTNLAQDGQPRVRLVLAGGSVLEERLAHPKLESFSQRLVARCYLESFNRNETETYIRVQIDSVGGGGKAIFSDETCRSVYQATDGVPRLINQVCDHALLLAYVAGRHQIEPAHVDEAWADLQQLPTPWTEERPQADGDVIEFGALDDLPADEHPPSTPQLRITPEIEGPEIEGPDRKVVEPAEQLDRIEQVLANVEQEFQPAGSIRPEVELIFDEPHELLREPFEEEEVVADRYAPPTEPEDQRSGSPFEATTDLPGEPLSARATEDTGPQGFEDVSLPDHPEPAESAEPDDSDMVIVEETCDEVEPATCPIVPVRRHEYGQLFAKLRRG